MSRPSQRNAWLIQHCYNSPYGTTQLEKIGKRGSFGPQKASFGGPGCPRRALGGKIWSQLRPIGLPGLDSWSPHTLTWYRALSTAQFLSGCILYQPLLTCTIFIRAPANYRVVHLVIFGKIIQKIYQTDICLYSIFITGTQGEANSPFKEKVWSLKREITPRNLVSPKFQSTSISLKAPFKTGMRLV